MRIAVVSDIHGNLTALDAVLKDLRETSPDLVLHGGDLADSGSSPVAVVDRIRDLGWPGVVGNTDEMVFRPRPVPNFPIVEEQAAWTRGALGEERVAWLSSLPEQQIQDPLALVHASPESRWTAPMPGAGDAELEAVYRPLGQPVAVYGHIHRPYIRKLPHLLVVNTGSVSLSHDGDRRASYLLLDEGEPQIRRVDYDVDREIEALQQSGIPHADWIAKMLAAAGFQTP